MDMDRVHLSLNTITKQNYTNNTCVTQDHRINKIKTIKEKSLIKLDHVHIKSSVTFTIMRRQPKNPFRYRFLGRSTPFSVAIFARKIRIHERFYATNRESKCIFGHVSETNSEPARFRTVARRTGRDIQSDVVNNLLPQLHLRFESIRAQQMPQIHPAEQTGVALKARDPGFP